MNKDTLTLLQELITTPSFSKQEEKTANIIHSFFSKKEVESHLIGNNVWAKNKFYHSDKPTLLLNSHHDTVKPNNAYTRSPFLPSIEEGVLFGLGSNDAGGSLVCLIEAFLYFYHLELPFNIILLASAEEEISGKGGVELALEHLPKIDFGIVGEPTKMEAAISEKGLMVVDAVIKGIAGHAARKEGENAIYKVQHDLAWISTYQFPKVSKTLGEVVMSMTQINAGSQHNIVPSSCAYVLDIRLNDCYNHEEILEILSKHLKATISPRSTRIKPSALEGDHPLMTAVKNLSLRTYGSPTTSDQALMNFPTLKIGPGDSGRSHSSDEYILLSELKIGVQGYQELITQLIKEFKILNEKNKHYETVG